MELSLRQKQALQKSIHCLAMARKNISEAHLVMMQAGLERPRISSQEIKQRMDELENLLNPQDYVISK